VTTSARAYGRLLRRERGETIRLADGQRIRPICDFRRFSLGSSQADLVVGRLSGAGSCLLVELSGYLPAATEITRRNYRGNLGLALDVPSPSLTYYKRLFSGHLNLWQGAGT
jgi:hypothetical protein